MSDAFRELGRRLRPRKLSFEPCLPRPAKVPLVGADWIHEIKHDGFRIVARKDATGVRLVTVLLVTLTMSAGSALVSVRSIRRANPVDLF